MLKENLPADPMERAKYHTGLNIWKLWGHPIPLILLLLQKCALVIENGD